MKRINVQKFEPYKPPFSVWKLIETQVSTEELSVVKSFIGESCIEYCIDLRNELEILLDIWKEVGDRVEPPTITKNMVSTILPDPPQLKEMLTKEIQLLVKEIQEKNGVSNEHKYDANEKKVIQYAMISQTPEIERPMTPLRKSNSDAAASSTLKLKDVKRNISASNIDAVSELLREAIQKECKQLENDIEFLQKCVEEEHDVLRSRPTSPIEEPSVAQLRQVCRNLEAKALTPSSSIIASTSRQPTPPTKRLTPPSPQRIQLKPIEATSLPSASKSSSNIHPNRQRLSSKTFDSANLEEILDQDPDVRNCWFEPSWSICMSDSLPPSTGDSGVSSRPGTCEISALRERRRHLTPDVQKTPASNPTAHIRNHIVNDVGYQTSSSSELSNLDFNRLSVTDSTEIHSSRTFSVPIPPNPVSPSISPHPPKTDIMKLSRKNVSARRFSRKLVKTT